MGEYAMRLSLIDSDNENNVEVKNSSSAFGETSRPSSMTIGKTEKKYQQKPKDHVASDYELAVRLSLEESGDESYMNTGKKPSEAFKMDETPSPEKEVASDNDMDLPFDIDAESASPPSSRTFYGNGNGISGMASTSTASSNQPSQAQNAQVASKKGL